MIFSINIFDMNIVKILKHICQSFLTTRPVFSFLYFLKFLVLIYQNLIFKILYLLIFVSSFQIFYSFFQIYNGLPLKRYNSIRNLFFLAISKHLRKRTDNFRKINWYNAKDKCEDHILVVFEDLFFWLYNNFLDFKIYETINEINFY